VAAGNAGLRILTDDSGYVPPEPPGTISAITIIQPTPVTLIQASAISATNFTDLTTSTLPDLISQQTAAWEPSSEYGYLFLSLAGMFLFVFVAMFVRSMAWRAD
jgi:hypothetical protein